MARRRTLAILVVLAIAGACEVAHAEPVGSAPEEETAAPAYTLEVDSDAPAVISYDLLASRLASDLGAEVVASGTKPSRAAILVRYREADRSLAVRAVHAGGRVLERIVTAEGDPTAVQREAVLLAGNLARDEARELLDALSARAPKDEAAVPPSPPSPPSPPEAPARPGPPVTPPQTRGEVLASAAFVYPIATNVGWPRVASWLDFSLGYGRVGGTRALQLGGVVVHSGEYVHGTQIGGALTITREVRGVQLAPVNVAEDVEGAQLGVVNVARRVRGVQIGVVNVAEEVDGGAIGLVTVNRAGIHPVAWSSNLTYLNVGLKFATKYLYTITGAHYGTLETQLEPRFGTTGAAGVHLPFTPSFDVEIEAAFTNIQPGGPGKRSNSWFHSRILPGFAFGPRFRVFAGGGFRAPIDVDVGESVFRPELMGGLQF